MLNHWLYFEVQKRSYCLSKVTTVSNVLVILRWTWASSKWIEKQDPSNNAVFLLFWQALIRQLEAEAELASFQPLFSLLLIFGHWRSHYGLYYSFEAFFAFCCHCNIFDCHIRGKKNYTLFENHPKRSHLNFHAKKSEKYFLARKFKDFAFEKL